MSREHLVLPGECIASLAARHGVSVATIWDHPDNAALRELRPSPHQLVPGDVVHLPDGTSRGHQVSPGTSHAFSGTPPLVELRLSLLEPVVDDTPRAGTDVDDPQLDDPEPPRPVADIPFRIEVGGFHREGTTDGQGLLITQVPATATSARLWLEPDTERERYLGLDIGHLHPADEPTGLQHRLGNLGYLTDDEDDALPRAIRGFQRDADLDVTGELDPATAERLREEGTT